MKRCTSASWMNITTLLAHKKEPLAEVQEKWRRMHPKTWYVNAIFTLTFTGSYLLEDVKDNPPLKMYKDQEITVTEVSDCIKGTVWYLAKPDFDNNMQVPTDEEINSLRKHKRVEKLVSGEKKRKILDSGDAAPGEEGSSVTSCSAMSSILFSRSSQRVKGNVNHIIRHRTVCSKGRPTSIKMKGCTSASWMNITTLLAPKRLTLGWSAREVNMNAPNRWMYHMWPGKLWYPHWKAVWKLCDMDLPFNVIQDQT